MISRRSFLTKTSVAAGTLVLPYPLRSQQTADQVQRAANDRLRLAFIGVGRRGAHNLKELTKQGDEVAVLCDVDQRYLESAAMQFPKARQVRDFRESYEKVDDFDAVVVSIPEHTHAYATLPALRAGKHVYCEKPLTHNIAESRLIAEAAASAGVATQMGTQIHASSNYRRVVELIRGGAIGPVSEAHVWVSRAWGLQSPEDAKANKDVFYVADRPTEGMAPPPFLDWNLWLGPSQERPYHEAYFPGPRWYRWWDWGSGTMSDLGSHWNDLPFWALDLDAPRTVVADGPPPHPEIAPASMSATYEYGPRGDRPACTVHWHQGTHKPEIWKAGEIPQWSDGVLFIGKNGMLLSNYSRHVLLPEADFADFEPPERSIPDSPGHHQEWLDACRNETPTGSPFSYAGALTEANHLGNVAYRAGGMIEWDRDPMKIPNRPAAERFLRRENPREGWEVA